MPFDNQNPEGGRESDIAQVVSGIFFMCLPDRVLIYGDCAVNPEPTADELADIVNTIAITAIQAQVD